MLKRLLHPVSIIFLICVITYGTLVNSLGFYWDDWPLILMTKAEIGFYEFFQYNRPYSFWIYNLISPFLGISPLNWHVFAILLWATLAICMWWTFRLIWPKYKLEAFAVGALFAIYPSFFQHSTAVAFSQHFVTYLVFFISIAGMLAYLRSEKKRNVFLMISLAAEALHLFTMEYFWGLELVRPVVIWIVLGDIYSDKKLLKISFAKWTPYLIIFLAAISWRLFFFPGIEDPNTFNALQDILSSPFAGLLNLGQVVLKDFLQIMVAGWYKTLNPSIIDFKVPAIVISWLVVILASLLVWFFTNNMVQTQTSSLDHASRKQMILVGTIALLTAMIPAWVVGREITVGFYSNRLSLPALFGAVILLVVITSWLISNRKHQIFILSLLIGLGAGAQFRTRNDYRWDWTNQQRFFWQLHWRMPALEKETALLADGAFFKYTGEYPTAMAINTLYSDETGSNKQPYWFFEIDRNFLYDPKPVINNGVIKNHLHQLHFEGTGHQIILVTDDAVEGQCIWVLTDSDAANPVVSEMSKTFLQISNSDLIDPNAAQDSATITEIFGDEPDPKWCFYYQKANLAKQNNDWAKVLEIYGTLSAQSLAPNNVFEWQVFIESAGLTGDWELARDITVLNHNKNRQAAPLYCSIWNSLIESTPGSDARDEIISNIFDELRCQRFQ